MLRIVVLWPWIASLALASTAFAQRKAIERDSIRAYDERSTLVFRVVDENGPVARRELEVSVGRSWRKQITADGDDRIGGSTSGGGRTDIRTTDENGVLRVPLGDSDQLKNPARPITVSDFAPIEFEEVWLRLSTDDSFAERTLWSPLPAGELELDEVVLRPMPVVAAGRVTDAKGQPVRGARVIGRNMESSLPLRAETDEAGGFVLRDTVLPPDHVQLLAMTADGLSQVLTTTGGSQDVSLVVSRQFGELTGQVLLAPAVARDRLRIYLCDNWWSYHLSPSDGLDFECELDEHGSFTLGHVLPETYVMKIHADRMEVASLPVGLVQPGTVQAIEPVDLRQKLRAIRLTLMSGDAPSRFAGTCAILDRKGFGASESFAFEGPSCLLLTTGEPLDIDLRVQGYRTVRLAGLTTDWNVDLEPGWPVRLVVQDEFDTPRPTVSWAIALRLVGELVFGEPIEFPAGSREVSAVVPDAGEYAVGWIRRERAGSSVYESYYPEPDYPRIEIRDVAGEQEFEFYAPMSR